MKKKEEKASLIETGLLNPIEKDLLKFLDELYATSFDNSKKWEKSIFDFFKENPFVIYIIQRTLVEEDDLHNSIIDAFKTKESVCYINSQDIFKDLIKLRELIKICPQKLKDYYPSLFYISRNLRQILTKVIDTEDSSFKNYKWSIHPVCSELTFSDNPNKVYENIWFICADSSINYPFDIWAKQLSKKFDERIKKLYQVKKDNPKKRNPLDSKLRHEVFKRDNYTCKECGATKKEKMLHCDHIISVAQGGSDEMDNLQTLCDDCNGAKSDKCFKAGEIK